MRTILFFFFLIAFPFCSFSQTVNFTPDSAGGCQPFCVAFQDLSANGIAWQWEFGDNTTSNVENPMHCYLNPGLYSVTLIETFSNTVIDTGYATISVFPNPVAAFTTVYSFPNTYTFTDQSTGNAAAWNWDFGDATTSSAQNPVHSYGVNGVYSVCLTAINIFGCSDTACHNEPAFDIGIDEVMTDDAWQLYPNPAGNEVIIVKLDTPLMQPVEFCLLNSLGQIVKNQKISGTTTVDVSGIAHGTYFVRLGNSSVKKIIL